MDCSNWYSEILQKGDKPKLDGSLSFFDYSLGVKHGSECIFYFKTALNMSKINIHVHIIENCVLSIVIVREGIYLFIDIFLFRNFLRFKYLTLSTSFSSQQTWRTQSARRRRSALINFASYFGIINTLNPMIRK